MYVPLRFPLASNHQQYVIVCFTSFLLSFEYYESLLNFLSFLSPAVVSTTTTTPRPLPPNCILSPDPIYLFEEKRYSDITRTTLLSPSNQTQDDQEDKDGWLEWREQSDRTVDVQSTGRTRTRRHQITNRICTIISDDQSVENNFYPISMVEFYPYSVSGFVSWPIIPITISLTSNDPLAKMTSAVITPLKQQRGGLASELLELLNLGTYRIARLVETFTKTSTSGTVTNLFLISSKIISNRILKPIRTAIINDANKRLSKKKATSKKTIAMDDFNDLAIKFQVSSSITNSTVNVTTLTATINSPFYTSLVITLSEDVNSAVNPSYPYATSVVGVSGLSKKITNTKWMRKINQTTTSKSMIWRDYKHSNLYPLFIIESVTTPTVMNLSLTLTDPLFSVPGASALAPWNGTLAMEIKGLTSEFLGHLLNYTKTHKDFSILTFESTFNCAADTIISSVRKLMLDDANDRLKNNTETSDFQPFSTLKLSDDTKAITKTVSNYADAHEFSALFTDPLYTVELNIHLSGNPSLNDSSDPPVEDEK